MTYNLLKIGSSGLFVTKIQQILNQTGFVCPISGHFDIVTAQNVVLYQKAHKLDSDGIVGPCTWASMLSTNQNIDAFCHAIQTREGFYAPGENPQYPHGTPAWINNNPGDLVFAGQVNAIANGRFAKFRTYQDGYNALKNLVISACTGQSKYYNSDGNFYSFFGVYAPSSDNNDPKSYAEQVAKALGIDPMTQIKNIL